MNGLYEVVVLNQNTQQFILDHIDAVIERANTACELQGKPWTAEQEALLMDLYQKGDSAFRIAKVFKRQPTSIRARIRRLRKQGRLNNRKRVGGSRNKGPSPVMVFQIITGDGPSFLRNPLNSVKSP